MKSLITSFLVLILGAGAGYAVYNKETPMKDTRPSLGELSLEEREGLVYMREEEKLARDVYLTLYKKWGSRVFDNISQSEQTHTEAVQALLAKYDIEDPVSDDTVGVFTNIRLAQLYQDLTTRGSVSIAEAYAVGVLIEEMDIADLRDRLAKTDKPDIRTVYENLLSGSENHLRAFTKNRNTLGVY